MSHLTKTERFMFAEYLTDEQKTKFDEEQAALERGEVIPVKQHIDWEAFQRNEFLRNAELFTELTKKRPAITPFERFNEEEALLLMRHLKEIYREHQEGSCDE